MRSSDNEIYVLDPRTGRRLPDSHVPTRIPTPVPHPVTRRPKGTCLKEIHTPVGGDVSLNQKESPALVQIFSGPKATRSMEVKALIDTGSPATFI